MPLYEYFEQEQFGVTTIPFFKTMEESFEYIRVDWANP
jgi:hypothetical protein